MVVKHVRVCVLACLAAAAMGCGNRGAAPTAASAPGKTIADPEAYARAHFEKECGSTGTVGTYVDYRDRGGVATLLIVMSATTGLSGAPHLVFKRTPAGYVLLGEIFMHPWAYRVLPSTVQGDPRLVVYIRSSASEGDLIWYTYRGGKFVEDRRELIHPGDSGTDKGRRRYAEVIGRDPFNHRQAPSQPAAK